MAHWLVKGDPEDYGAADLQREKITAWTGVKNPVAQKHLRSFAKNDDVLLYHTGNQKAIVATANVARAAYPDPTDKSSKLVAVDLQFKAWLARPITLAEIKADAAFEKFDLVRISRLSVMPVSAAHWQRIMRLTQEPQD